MSNIPRDEFLAHHRGVFDDMLERARPEALEAVPECLEAMGFTRLLPYGSGERMPLTTALGRDDEGIIGLLHWPTPQHGVTCVVVRLMGHRLRLLAGSIEDWVGTVAARMEAEGRLSESLAERVSPWFEVGSFAQRGLPFMAWEVMYGGGAPWAYEHLMARHELRGDLQSALMTAERCTQRAPGWGAPHVWRHTLLLRLGLKLQARDAAVEVMGLPVWTHTSPFAPLARAIGWTPPIDGSPYERLAKDDQRPPLDRAAHWMDYAAVEQTPWSAIRDVVRSCYVEAKQPGVAALIGA